MENKSRHLRIEIHQRDALDLRILQNFAHRQTIAPAQHQHAARRRHGRQSGMDQRLVVAILVARTELQMAVQEQPDVVFEPGQDNVLIASIASEDDFVRVDVVFGRHRDAFGLRPARPRVRTCTTTHKIRNPRTDGQLLREQKRAPQRHCHVDQPEQHGGAHQPEIGHQQNRKQKRGPERAEIVERQDVGDYVAKVITVLTMRIRIGISSPTSIPITTTSAYMSS